MSKCAPKEVEDHLTDVALPGPEPKPQDAEESRVEINLRRLARELQNQPIGRADSGPVADTGAEPGDLKQASAPSSAEPPKGNRLLRALRKQKSKRPGRGAAERHRPSAETPYLEFAARSEAGPDARALPEAGPAVPFGRAAAPRSAPDDQKKADSGAILPSGVGGVAAVLLGALVTALAIGAYFQFAPQSAEGPAVGSAARAAAAELNAALSAEQEKTLALSAELTAFETRMAAMEQDAAQRASAASVERRELSEALAAAEVESTVLKSKLAEADERSARLTEELAAAQSAIDGDAGLAEKLTGPPDGLGRQIAGLDADLQSPTEGAARFAAQEEAIARNEAQDAQLVAAVEVAEAEAGRLEAALKEARERNDELTLALAAAEGEVSRLQAVPPPPTPATNGTTEDAEAPGTAAAKTAESTGASVQSSESTNGTAPGAIETASLGASATTGGHTSEVDVDRLVSRPGDFRDQQVSVSGSLAYVLWQYRLQTDTSRSSLVVNVAGLSAEDLALLEQARAESGFLFAHKVRLRGTVELDTPLTYRLSASALELLD